MGVPSLQELLALVQAPEWLRPMTGTVNTAIGSVATTAGGWSEDSNKSCCFIQFKFIRIGHVVFAIDGTLFTFYCGFKC